MAALVGRQRPATPLMRLSPTRLSLVRLLVSALVVSCVIIGAMACAVGLATAHTPLVAIDDCTVDTPHAGTLETTAIEAASIDRHRSHLQHATTLAHEPTAGPPISDRSDAPSDAPHHAAEAHPGMACVVNIDLTRPAVSATTASVDVVVPESMPSGRSPEPDPPVPKISSIHH